jgi:hypothetical protein
MWKTKKITRSNDTTAILMICQNSNPSSSKWIDFLPENGPCKNWIEVSPKTTAVLCHECTSRTVSKLKL